MDESCTMRMKRSWIRSFFQICICATASLVRRSVDNREASCINACSFSLARASSQTSLLNDRASAQAITARPR